MPELPEVETTRRGILPHLKSNVILECKVHQPRLRWPIPKNLPKQLKGQQVQDVERRGKYLLIRFKHGTLIAHLGMSGRFYLADTSTSCEKHTHFEAKLDSGKSLRFVDPRRFGALLWTDEPPESYPLIQSLGPEPLSSEFDGDYLFEASRKRTKAVKLFIMDSKIVVGVGNIYANEALYRAGIRPERTAGRISRQRYLLLAKHIQSILCEAIEQGGTTLKDFYNGSNQPGYFKQSLAVYGRGGLPCLECGRRLKEIRLGQRQTVFCGHCQS